MTDRRRGTLLVLGAALLWSSGGLFIKAVDADTFVITAWRSTLAAVTIGIALRPHPRSIFNRSWLTWALAISYAAMLLTFVAATRQTTAANAIFLQYTAPLYVLILGGRLLGERPGRVDVIATIVAFAGMGLFFIGKLDGDAMTGNVLAIASGVAFAIFLLLLRSPRCDRDTRPGAMVLGNLLLVIIAVPIALDDGARALFAPGWQDVAALLFLGVVQIGLAYVAFGRGIALIPALEAGLIGMLEPVLNPVWVFLVLGERPGWWAAAGGLVIIIAVGARTYAAERRQPGPVVALT